MTKRSPFSVQDKIYSFSHLENKIFNFTRPESGDLEARTTKILLSYSDHCFTDHFGEDDHFYSKEGVEDRYLCPLRYKLSLGLPDLIKKIVSSNPYIGRTYSKGRREQFFYVEEHYKDETYRMFLEFSPLRNSKNIIEGIRIDVKSAYDEKPHASRVSVDKHFRVWRVVDARIEKIKLDRNR
jgi:hypothetical protein